MSVVVDSSVIIDVLRGDPAATDALAVARSGGRIHANEVTRLEILAGMRATEETETRRLLAEFIWHPIDESNAEIAGELGRRWLRANRGIDTPDLAIAATAIQLNAPLLTRNVKHFPMFEGLNAPY